MALTRGQIEKERRNRANFIEIKDAKFCYNCNYPSIKEEEAKCPKCNFPQKGSQIQMRKFIWKVREDNQERKTIEKKFKRYIEIAKWLLLFLSFGLFMVLILDKPFFLAHVNFSIAILSVAFIFLASSLFIKKHPKIFSLSAFLSYLFINFFIIFYYPEWSNAYLVRIIIMISLFSAVKFTYIKAPKKIKKFDLKSEKED